MLDVRVLCFFILAVVGLSNSLGLFVTLTLTKEYV